MQNTHAHTEAISDMRGMAKNVWHSLCDTCLTSRVWAGVFCSHVYDAVLMLISTNLHKSSEVSIITGLLISCDVAISQLTSHRNFSHNSSKIA